MSAMCSLRVYVLRVCIYLEREGTYISVEREIVEGRELASVQLIM